MCARFTSASSVSPVTMTMGIDRVAVSRRNNAHRSKPLIPGRWVLVTMMSGRLVIAFASASRPSSASSMSQDERIRYSAYNLRVSRSRSTSSARAG